MYADAEFDYDEPVFVKHNFLGHLKSILPKVQSMVGSTSLSSMFQTALGLAVTLLLLSPASVSCLTFLRALL